MVELAVDSMRCEAWGLVKACLRRPGRIMEAIAVIRARQLAGTEAVEVGGRKTISRNGPTDVDDNASDERC